MNAVDLTPKLSPRFIVYVRNYLLDNQIDPTSVFQECGINDVIDSEHAIPLPTAKLIQLIDCASRVSEDSLLGFNMATHFHYESSALIVLAMLAAPNVELALKTLSHFDRYVDTGITTAYDFGAEQSTFSAQLLGVDCTSTSHLNEYLLTFTVHSLNTATRKRMPISEVHFQHARDSDQEIIADFFATEVKYEQESNRLFFDSAHLGEHLFTSNELLYDILQNALRTYFYADTPGRRFVDSVCRELMISTELKNSTQSETRQDVSLDAIAEKLTISTRTLRRRLKEDGYNFQDVKSLVRERLAKYFLGNTKMTLSEIAYAVGFSELSAFSRAFKNWTCSTPQEYRNTVRRLMSA